MDQAYDVVLVGGGHNGLTAAGYLLQAGLSVCIVEKNDEVGGGVATQEVTIPGFRHDLHSIMHSVVRANPLIAQDELGLCARYGLEYIEPEAQIATPFIDGSSIVIYKDVEESCKSISKVSPRDAEAYSDFVEWGRSIYASLKAVGLFSGVRPFSEVVRQLESSPQGREALSLLQASTFDLLDGWFEHDGLKAMIAKFTSEWLLGPDEQGTALSSLIRHMGNHVIGSGYPRGGSGELARALRDCVLDAGGVIVTGHMVDRIMVENGRAVGVRLGEGDAIKARRAVLSSVHAAQLFLDLVGPDHVDKSTLRMVKSLRPSSFAGVVCNYALKEEPKYFTTEDVGASTRVELVESTHKLREHLTQIRSGRIPSAKVPYALCHTRHDPSRVSGDGHTLYLYDFVPYGVHDSGFDWDTNKEEVADGILGEMRKYCSNMGDENILGRAVYSPLDQERYNPSFMGGDFNHIAQTSDLLFGNEPYPGWGSHRGPCEGLYLCGASTHPGGGVTGASGRAAAGAILKDMGMAFEPGALRG